MGGKNKGKKGKKKKTGSLPIPSSHTRIVLIGIAK